MNAGVQWPTSADAPCAIERKQGWSDLLNRGTTGDILDAARGGAGVRDAHGDAQQAGGESHGEGPTSRPMGEVVRALQRQLEDSFVGRAKLQALTRGRSPARIVLRARVLEAADDGSGKETGGEMGISKERGTR